MQSLGHLIVARAKRILLVTGVLLLVAGFIGSGVLEHLSTGGFDDPNSEAALTAARAQEIFGVSDPDFVLLVDARGGSVDAPRVRREATALTQALAREAGVARAESYWSLDSAPPLRSRDGSKALILVNLHGTQNEKNEILERIGPRYTASGDSIDVSITGYSEIFRQITSQVEKDLIRAELVAIPILLALLLVVFRSVVAASLPLGPEGK